MADGAFVAGNGGGEFGVVDEELVAGSEMAALFATGCGGVR